MYIKNFLYLCIKLNKVILNTSNMVVTTNHPMTVKRMTVIANITGNVTIATSKALLIAKVQNFGVAHYSGMWLVVASAVFSGRISSPFYSQNPTASENIFCIFLTTLFSPIFFKKSYKKIQKKYGK